MITAEEARLLSGQTANEFLQHLETLIKDAAAEGSREIYVRTPPYATWLYSEQQLNPEEQKAVDALRANGFSVSMYYNCGQFVDMALIISWEKTEEKQP